MPVSANGCYICRPGPRWREFCSCQWGGESPLTPVSCDPMGSGAAWWSRGWSCHPVLRPYAPRPRIGRSGGEGSGDHCHMHGATAPGGGYTVVLCGLRRGRQLLAPPSDRAQPHGCRGCGLRGLSSAPSRSCWAQRPSVRDLWLRSGWGRLCLCRGKGHVVPSTPPIGSTRCGVSGSSRG